ncbi:entericidin A/B family lipoprotein [Parvibaculum lavamentivorans]|nr:entericidin A/B family lipoprotein [Parvibaculum lavamentivorans]
MKHVFAMLALLVAGFGLAACNTVEGAGQDIQRGGAAIEDTANDAK